MIGDKIGDRTRQGRGERKRKSPQDSGGGDALIRLMKRTKPPKEHLRAIMLYHILLHKQN